MLAQEEVVGGAEEEAEVDGIRGKREGAREDAGTEEVVGAEEVAEVEETC